MKSLIDKIIEIDQNARIQVEKANAEASKIVEDANVKREALQKEYGERAEKRLETVRETYRRFAEEEIAEIDKKRDAGIKTLEACVDEHKNAWKKEIIDRIVG